MLLIDAIFGKIDKETYNLVPPSEINGDKF